MLKLKKLAVGKTYKVQVRAKNAAGFGKWSKAVKVTIKNNKNRTANIIFKSKYAAIIKICRILNIRTDN